MRVRLKNDAEMMGVQRRAGEIVEIDDHIAELLVLHGEASAVDGDSAHRGASDRGPSVSGVRFR